MKETLRNRLATTGVLTFALGVAGISMASSDVAAAPAKQLRNQETAPQPYTPIPYYQTSSSWAQNQMLLNLQPQLSQQQQLILPQQQQQLMLNQALLQNALYNDLVYQGIPVDASTTLPASTEFVLD